jgi:protein TonB
MRWQARGGAIVAPDPRAVFAIAAPPRVRAGLTVALPLSLVLHAGVLLFALRDPAPLPVPPAAIEVSLLREPEPAPGPPVVAPAPVPVAQPKPVVRKPTPPRVAAVVKPAPVAEPAPAAPSAGEGDETSPAPVAAAPASGGGGGSGGPSDPLESYVASVLRRIEARKRYPSLAKSRGIEGTVVVTLWISPAGALDRLEVGGEAPPLLVTSTKEAIQQASPFPPPPAGLPSIRVPIRYALR